jgi:hypothetical protein
VVTNDKELANSLGDKSAQAARFTTKPSMARAEKRKKLRRTVSYPAWVELGDGSPAQECSLCDASDKGAKLTFTEPDKLPDNFILALSADGAATRFCRVVWKTGNQVGVEFLKRPDNAAQERPLRFDHPLPAGIEVTGETER